MNVPFMFIWIFELLLEPGGLGDIHFVCGFIALWALLPWDVRSVVVFVVGIVFVCVTALLLHGWVCYG